MTYSTTLDGAITADQLEIYVDNAPPTPLPPLVQIGTELLGVDWASTDFSTPSAPTDRIRLGVRRAQFGTTAATHADNAAVNAVVLVVQTDAPTAPPPATAGAAQTVTRVGPIARTFETTDIDDSAAVAAVADLPAGSLLVSAWAVVRESFDDGSGNGVVDLYLAVRPAAGSTPLSAAIHYGIGGGDPSPKGRDLANAPAEFPANPVYSFPIVAQDDCEFVAYVTVSGGITLSQGDVDVYALIATPA